jgi:hypothetical protein
MAKQEHSRYQQQVIRRYYENRDSIALQRLGEIVSELYLCESEKKAEQLWKRAEQALDKAGANQAHAANVVAKRDVQGLARLLNEMSVNGGS